jgi:hypothetical protein
MNICCETSYGKKKYDTKNTEIPRLLFTKPDIPETQNQYKITFLNNKQILFIYRVLNWQQIVL